MIDIQTLIIMYMHVAHSLSLHMLGLRYTMAHIAQGRQNEAATNPIEFLAHVINLYRIFSFDSKWLG